MRLHVKPDKWYCWDAVGLSLEAVGNSRTPNKKSSRYTSGEKYDRRTDYTSNLVLERRLRVGETVPDGHRLQGGKKEWAAPAAPTEQES